jgi:acetyl esterase
MTNSKSHYKKIRRNLFNQGFKLFALAKSHSAYQRSARKRCQIIRNIAYLPDGSKANQLDIYRPKNSTLLRPVIIYIHGGGFTMCSKDTHQGVALAYANNGYVVFNVNYRLAPKHRYPAALEDVAYAWQWIVNNAAHYGGDPQRITVAGESAGGNLTLALATACCFRLDEPVAKFIWDIGVVPKSIMVLCGMLQVSNPHRLKNVCPPINRLSQKLDLSIAADVSRAYLGSEYKSFQPNRMLADPLMVIESEFWESDSEPDRMFPITYAMVGTHDILFDDTRRLEKVLTKRSIRHTVSYFPNQGHAFHLLGFSNQAKIFWKENLAFLAGVAGAVT